MAYRRVELAVGEWFHCYTRTIDRSRIFGERSIAERFLETLYLANQGTPMPAPTDLHRTHSHTDIFSLKRDPPLVSIAAYSVMPTHYHLLIQPLHDDGLSEFMHKVGTGFTRFYNDREARVGNLFIKPFRSRHISNDAYFLHIPNYIHLNAAELFEPQWKRGRVRDARSLERLLLGYPNSSLPDYKNISRPRRSVLDEEAVSLFRQHLPPLRKSIDEAAEYYRFLELEL
jgi:putative transposase